MMSPRHLLLATTLAALAVPVLCYAAETEGKVAGQLTRIDSPNARGREMSELSATPSQNASLAEKHRRRGNGFSKQRKYREAAAEYREAIRLDPNNGRYYSNLCVVLIKQDDYAEAVIAGKQGIKVAPDDAQIRDSLGTAFHRQEKYEEAAAEYRVAIRLKPDEGKYHANLAGVLLKQGRPQKALDSAKRAISLGHEEHWVLDELNTASNESGSRATTLERAASGDDPSRVVVNLDQYQGKAKGDPRFDMVFAQLAEQAERAITVTQQVIGITPRRRSNVRVRLADMNVEKGVNNGVAYTTQDGKQCIDLFVEHYISGNARLDIVLQHEIVHAVMRDAMGTEAYRSVPDWFREGVALFVAREGEHKTSKLLPTVNGPEDLLTGLLDEGMPAVAYPHAWAAIELIEQTGGTEAVKRVTQLVVDGCDADRAVVQVTGLSWDEFTSRLRAYALNRFRKLAAGREQYARARAHLRSGTKQKAIQALQEFVERYPDSAYVPTAQFYVAKTYYDLRSYERAVAEFKILQKKYRGKTGLLDESVLYTGLSAYGLRQPELAAEVLEDYVWLFPFSSDWSRGLYFLAMSHRDLGDLDRARDQCERVVSDKRTKSKYRDLAKKALAKLR